MLFDAFGEEVHQSALRDYLAHHVGGTARPEDLWKSFEPYVSISSGLIKLSIKEVMDTWTNQPGYPVVHASVDDSIVTLTQVTSCSHAVFLSLYFLVLRFGIH